MSKLQQPLWGTPIKIAVAKPLVSLVILEKEEL